MVRETDRSPAQSRRASPPARGRAAPASMRGEAPPLRLQQRQGPPPLATRSGCSGAGSRATAGLAGQTFPASATQTPREGPRATPKEKSPICLSKCLTANVTSTIVVPMPTALHIAGLPSQSPQGVGARLVRLGGAVRSVIVRGIARALRRPAVPQTGRHHPEAQDPQAPAPRPARVPRQPRPALPVPSLPPPLLAHLLAARRHRRPACLNRGDKPFAPEAFPQLSPKACAVLNTPLKDCDPKTLELVFSTFASHINQLMSPEAGLTDLQAAFPNLWHRLNAALADTSADACLSTTPPAVSATPADAVPDAPVVPPHSPVQAPPTGPTRPSAKDTPRVAPLPLSDPPADATIIAAAPRTPPEIPAPFGPVVHRSRPFRHHTQSSTRWRRRDSQPRLPRRIRVYLCASVVPFSCYHYAASTGPP